MSGFGEGTVIKGIFAAGLLVAVTVPAAAGAQPDYCSAPNGYSATNCFGSVCEYTTDALFGDYIAPSLEVSRSGVNCAPLTSWPYYTLTSHPGSYPSSSLASDPPAADPPSPAPEISADDALAGLTMMAGLVLVGRGRRLTQ
jgi:hypothetical protein